MFVSETAKAKYGYRYHKYEVTPQGLRCAKCQRVKLTAAFHRNKQTHSGYHTWCKVCRKASHQQRRR